MSAPTLRAPAPIPLRCAGALASLPPATRAALLARRGPVDPAPRERVAAILDRVRKDGDRALRSLARELDGIELDALEVPRAARRAALAAMAQPLRDAMERAARNLAAVHAAFLPVAQETSPEPGVVVGRRPDPLARVGIYAPGGRARYPSSLLMAAVPARVAGVAEIVACSPPGADGRPAPEILAAAELVGVDRVFAIGGAGAIAALAFGTESVPPVDRVVGPGNAWVSEAKVQVSGRVLIDCPAGPSELLVIVDPSADPEAVARELVAQAEHDPEACAVAIAIGETTAERLTAALARVAAATPRRGIVARALAARGAVLSAFSREEALAFANEYAPEHLLLAIAEPRSAWVQVRNAGTVFLGESSSVAFGDYMTGANHVLPTGGAARAASGLSTLDFVRWTTWQSVSPEAAAALASPVACFAEAEGLPAHATAARAWGTP